ncbi:MAG TPA: FAD-binding protein [Chloroflexota bacterium]|jgi:xylitol oxidase|nr:FAD-binding protein [Chloroflexota bacterium]
MARTNWAGNHRFLSGPPLLPETVDDVRAVVKRGRKITALGTAHSFNGIADGEQQVSLTRLDSIVLDPSSNSVAVGAGVTYDRLSQSLHRRGFALHNLASVPRLSVAGACATGTHGSGDSNGNLSTAVSALELVTGEGEVVVLSRDTDEDRDAFQAAVIGLGGFGITTRIVLDVQPTFAMSQTVYEDLPVDELERNLDHIFASGYSVSLFLTWAGGTVDQAWVKRRVEQGQPACVEPEFFGARAAAQNLHPVPGQPAQNCTEQLGIPGPWHKRLPHFRMEYAPSVGSELQSEYFVPRDRAYEAIAAIERVGDMLLPHLYVSELRSIAPDELWLSPCYKRDSVGIHFTWKPDWPSVRGLLPLLEEQLGPFGARPHWGKLFSMSPSYIAHCYERWDDWTRLRASFDPDSKFVNEFLDLVS